MPPITKDFSKALLGIFIAAICVYAFSLFLQVKGLSGFSASTPITKMRVFLNQLSPFIMLAVFWSAVGFLTKEKIGAFCGFSIQAAYVIFQTYALYEDGIAGFSYHWTSITVSCSSFLAFGLIYFKNIKGVLFLLIPLISEGLSISSFGHELSNFINRLLDIIGLEDFFQYEVSTGENSYRTIDTLRPLIFRMYFPLLLTLFWFVFSSIKQTRKFDFSLRTLELFPPSNKITFSILYWVFRLSLFATVFGLALYLHMALGKDFYAKSIFKIFWFCVAIYVLGSLYRNILASYFTSIGWAPNGLYLFLHIPVLNFFAWLILMAMPNQSVKLPAAQEEAKEEEVNEGLQKARFLQKKFTANSRNAAIFILIIIFFVISLIAKVAGKEIGLLNNNLISEPLLFWVFSAFSLALMTWYYMDKNAFYILFGLQAIMLLTAVIIQNKIVMNLSISAGVFNLIYFYALYHFDQFTFVDSNSETELEV